MTRTLTRLTTVAAAIALGEATLGCGFISNIGNTVDNIQEVAALTDQMTTSADLTYTGEYTLVDGSGTATVVQQPPNAAFIGKDGRFILTSDSLLMCASGGGDGTTCQRAPNPGGDAPSADQAAYMTAVAGAGFISTPMAIGLMGTAAIVPGVEIEKSTKTVAGLKSACLHATRISTEETAETDVDLSEVTVCVADNGVLTVFRGTGTDGSSVGVELTTFSTTVDPNAFTAPRGAEVIDVGHLDA